MLCSCCGRVVSVLCLCRDCVVCVVVVLCV